MFIFIDILHFQRWSSYHSTNKTYEILFSKNIQYMTSVYPIQFAQFFFISSVLLAILSIVSCDFCL
jgi:hypothetical protein